MTHASSVSPASEPRRWLAFGVMVTAQFMFIVDAFIANVAIPSIRTSLHATPAQLEAVLAVYQLGYAILLITGGRLGDLFGRRRVFLLGLIAFTATSAGCGLAGSAAALIAWRFAQGLSAAMMVPQVLASVQALFTGAERDRALSIFGLVMGTGGAAGLLVGGALTSADIAGLGWRAAFLINLPVGLVAAVLGWRWIPRPTAAAAEVHLDKAGVAWMAISVAAVLVPLLFGRELHWPVWSLVLLVVGLLGMATFQQLEARVDRAGGTPLLPPALLQHRAFMTGLTASGLHYISMMAFFLVLTLYLQNGRQLSALRMGMVILPLAIAFLVTSRVANALVRRYGIRSLLGGLGLMAMGLLVLLSGFGTTWAHPIAPSMTRISIALALHGAGQGLVIVPLIGLILTGVPRTQAGAAAGLLITAQQLAGALGVACIGGLYFTFAADGTVTGMTHGTMAGCIAMLVALGAAATGFMQLGARQRQLAAAGVASPA
ncbi:MFS transporter [Ralstonia insidiosa]|uniref:MFS transporter n=1 Tax=Ralstonia TaxID=48736 RepID=UPI0006649283|nr:MFS transporter [Ralstonia insidiosa]KMW45156.1 MFS transporter [Ralstonia sp. MD27]MBX3773218.1 MFS transporter [Ralstonia pickettii]NOZ15923.1 MFS transporter [Betaproteobacteria bacterium]MBA9858706.1 MFS transporter [Ralstonia insidiosa]MBA9872887.1 MFS transporter [Ralstonia insidiosa]